MPKYIKRIGSPGNYKYFYNKNEIHKVASTNRNKYDLNISDDIIVKYANRLVNYIKVKYPNFNELNKIEQVDSLKNLLESKTFRHISIGQKEKTHIIAETMIQLEKTNEPPAAKIFNFKVDNHNIKMEVTKNDKYYTAKLNVPGKTIEFQDKNIKNLISRAKKLAKNGIKEYKAASHFIPKYNWTD